MNQRNAEKCLGQIQRNFKPPLQYVALTSLYPGNILPIVHLTKVEHFQCCIASADQSKHQRACPRVTGAKRSYKVYGGRPPTRNSYIRAREIDTGHHGLGIDGCRIRLHSAPCLTRTRRSSISLQTKRTGPANTMYSADS